MLLLAGCAGTTPEVEAPAAPAAPPATRPLFLFAVDRPGMPTSYLHGSVHMLKAQSDGREPIIDRAFEASDALVVELDVKKVDQHAVQALTVQLGMFPEGETLTDHVSPDTWEAVIPVLEPLGLKPEGVKRMRPWLLSITLSMLSIQVEGYSPENGVDMRYLTAAHEAQPPREVIALETAEEQLRAMAELPDEVQELMLDDTVKRMHDDSFFERMFEAWRTGDDEGLADLMFEPLRENPRFAPMYESLFFDRNRRMTERLVGLLQQPKSYFVVVGAAHLAGEQSIPELLRIQGYQVQQVHAP